MDGAARPLPSIAARRISFRLGSLAGWAFSEIGDRYATHGKIIRDVPGNGRLIKHELATAATRADEKPWRARFGFGYCAGDCTGLASLSAPVGSFACALAVWARRSRCMRWS